MSFGFNIQNVIWWKSLFGRFHVQIRLILCHADRKSDHHHRQGLTNEEDDDEEINGASPGNGGLRIVPGAVTFQNTEAMTKVRKGFDYRRFFGVGSHLWGKLCFVFLEA